MLLTLIGCLSPPPVVPPFSAAQPISADESVSFTSPLELELEELLEELLDELLEELLEELLDELLDELELLLEELLELDDELEDEPLDPLWTAPPQADKTPAAPHNKKYFKNWRAGACRAPLLQVTGFISLDIVNLQWLI